MATNTTNYNLVKPAYSDTADIADINGNMDIIDAQMKTNANGINTINNNLSNMYAYKQIASESSMTTVAVTPSASTTGKLLIASDSSTRCYEGMFRTLSNGNIGIIDIAKGSYISYATNDATITFTMNTAASIKVLYMRLLGSSTDPTCVFT